MGLRGPKGTPAAVKIMEGNPGQRPIPQDFVVPDGLARRPEHVKGYAATIWNRVVKAMPPGVYRATDAGVLEAYCLACERLRAAHQMLELQGHVIQPVMVVYDDDGAIVWNDEGLPVVLPTGKAYRNPWGVIMREATHEVATLGTRLGLDPMARENIKKPPDDKPKSKFAGLVGIDGGKV